MAAGYGMRRPPSRHATSAPRPVLPTSWVVVAAVTTALTCAVGSPWIGVVAALGAVVTRRPWVAAALVVVSLIATVRTDRSWDSLAPDRLGPVDGWATVVGEPQRYPGAVRVVVEVGAERYELWVRGRARQLRAATWRGGDLVRVAGELQPLDPERARRVAWQHVVGELEADWLGDRRPGGALAESSNRVRAVIARGAAVLPADQAALTRGLVIGDDRDQPPAMVERFRRSGLSHLTAVSGQNVAFVLAACGPLLRRARPVNRWVATVALIAWFVVLTRAEPSVLRAATMAGLSATAFLLGRQREPLRLLALAVTGLLLVDPLLAWSVGFWLSVGATAGVTGIGPWLAPRLAGTLGPVAVPVAITVGAQAGVALPSLVVFGRLSVVGTAANLVAVPVAGFVMLYGLPACLVAGAVPAVAPVVMVPVGAAVGWIDAVATVAARLEPPVPWSWLGWILLAGLIAVTVRRRRRRLRGWPPDGGVPPHR